jgi:hypothetical protein
MKSTSNPKIEKFRKIVHKMYPKAFICKRNNKFTVIQEQQDLSTIDVLQELYFNPTNSIEKAWELAASVVKTNQNLLRTHPLRIEGQTLEDKLARIESRKNKKYNEYH